MMSIFCKHCANEIDHDNTYYKYGVNLENVMCENCYKKNKLRKKIDTIFKVGEPQYEK